MKITKNRTVFKEKAKFDSRSIKRAFDFEPQDLAIFHAKTIGLFIKYFYIANSVIKGRHALYFHEDNERIYFVIKSKMDEYCFTNTAFIHLDGQSDTSKKRTLKRYPYRYFAPSQVSIEAAGTMDLDMELKFHLGGLAFSIDIDKSQIEGVRDIYKALTAIAERCQAIRHGEMVLEKTFETVTGMFGLKDVPEAASSIKQCKRWEQAITSV